MEADSDSEYETEEAVILVELNGIIDSNFLLEQQSPAKILGIDTDEPVLQLGHYIFNGEYEDTLGTVVVYQPVDSPKLDESFEDGYSYLCKTDKKLSMKRIFVQEKGEGSLKTSQAPQNEISIPNGSVNGHADDLIINPASMAGLENIETEANAQMCISDEKRVLSETSVSNGIPAEASTNDEVSKEPTIDLSETKHSDESDMPLHEGPSESNQPSEPTHKVCLKRKLQEEDDGNGSPSVSTETTPKKIKAIEGIAESQREMECSSVYEENSEVNNQALDSMETSENICSSSPKPIAENITSENSKSIRDLDKVEPTEQNTSESSFDRGNASTSAVNMETESSEFLENSEFTSPSDANQLVESSTDKMLVSLPLSNQSIPRDDNCSSSGDTGASKTSPSHNLDVCQSSDSKNDSAEFEKTENDTATSSQTVKVSDVNVKSPSVSHEVKSTSCEVSQSLKEDTESPLRDDSDSKDNECEAYSSNNTLYGSIPSVSNEDSDTANIGTSDANQILDVTGSGTRKLSSCEVSQSNNSESEYLRNKDAMGECDVFVESPAPANENILPSSDSVPDAGTNEVDCARYSHTSEGSTSEISQSHRSVKLEGNYLEEAPRNAGDVCSQSSDKSQNTGLSESKDVCVSSCDVAGDSSEHHPSSGEKTTRVHPPCEVSQSDESDENAMASANLGSSRNEAEILNECAESDILVCEEFENEPREGDPSGGAQEAMIDTNTQNSCEVTQSFCSETNYAENSNIEDKTSSNECGIYDDSIAGIEASGGTSNNSCVSSDEIGEFSGSVSMGIENNPVERDSRCEVSQSFSPAPKSIEVEESCASSDAETKYEDQNCLFMDETESQNYGEVSQSLEPESAYIILESDDDEDMNECNQDEIFEASEIPPSDSSFEICESSDAVAIHISNEEACLVSAAQQLGTGCEVSQSDRLEESSLNPHIQLAIAVEIDGSNECEVAESMSIQEPNLIYCIPGENSICESSDDVDNASEVQRESLNALVSLDVCQSSKSEEDIQLLAGVSEGNDSTENSPNESIGVCESSEDVQILDHVNTRTDSDACTSSQRSGIEEQSHDNMCDSFSRQSVSGSSSRTFSQGDNNIVSQSQTDGRQSQVYVVAPSSSEQSVSVIVSSSGDTRSLDGTDVIYSSPNISNSNIASNVEVTQSSYSLPHVSTNVNLLPTGLPSVSAYEELNPDEQDLEIEECCVRSLVETSHNVVFESVDIVHTPSNDAYISSENSSNPLVESSTLNSSLIPEEQRIGSHSPSEQANLGQNVSRNEASTSQTYHKDNKRESVILENRKSVSTSSQSSTGDASHSNQPQQQEPPRRVSRWDNPNSRSRPSLLEVIVSSASDFRNSLLCDPNSFKDRNQVSSISESTSRIDSASGPQERNDANPSSIPSESSSFQSQNYELIDTEVSGSLEPDPNYAHNEPVSNLHRVSQSSDVVNTHSSSSNIHSQFTEGIGDSSQLDIVQSSSTTSKSTPYSAPNDSSDMSEQVSSAEGNSNFPSFKVSDSGEVSESSCAQIAIASCSGNSMLSSIEIIESSDDLPMFHESDASNFTYEGEVSSTPLIMQNARLQLLSADGSEQCSIIEGNVMLLSTDDSPDPSYEGSNINVSSANSGAEPFPPNDEVADATNEAETLNRSSMSSPPPRQLDPNEQLPLSSADIPTESVETNASDSPCSILEVVSEAYDCDGSSEVSESLAAEQSDVTQSSLTDSKVSCSAVEFTLNDQSMNRNYFNDSEFPNISREAESKSSDDCISSFNVCDDTVLQSQNIPSSANNELSMYSYEGEYDDSIQSSSLEAVQESIGEQIKAVSPQNYSNSSNDEGQASGSVDPYVPIVSESQSLSPVASVPNVDVSSSFPPSQSHELQERVAGAISSSEDSSNGLEISDFSADPQMVSHVITDSSTLQECLEGSNIGIDEFVLQPADEEPSELEVAEAGHLDVETINLFESANDDEKNC